MDDLNGDEFLAFCRKFDTAMLVTKSSSDLVARPMIIAQIDDSGNFWFSADRHSAKVEEIHNDPHVCVTMSGSIGHVSIRGTAVFVWDQDKIDLLWSEAWRVWFPKGSRDERLILLKVDAEEGAYWATSGVQKVQYLFSMVQSYIRGEKPAVNPETHGRVVL